MTNEVAIKHLTEYLDHVDARTAFYRAMILAISALEQQTCEDAVSREAVLEGIEELKKSPWATANRSHGYEYLITEALDVVKDLCVKQLPSVTQKSGKWIENRCDMYICSQCQHTYTDLSGERLDMNFCPNCGCRMVEPQESEDKE